ncbi:hypothetical protein BJV82DRAFT_670191 [Fennellomyces sp. T-0311]|nr:hypothetical protein BJV82DRAFT_670191 [Fennellomyces sp. T-0311]
MTHEPSVLDKAEPLDDEEVRRRIHAIIEDRNQHMKDAVDKMYGLLQQVADTLQAFASAHDQVMLEDMERELDGIKRLEAHQGNHVILTHAHAKGN